MSGLPEQLSNAVHEIANAFVARHEAKGVRGHLRWHGANLWMIYRDGPDAFRTEDGRLFIPRRQVSIGVFDAATPEEEIGEALRLIPGVMISPGGLTPEWFLTEKGKVQVIPLSPVNPWLLKSIGAFREEVRGKLYIAATEIGICSRVGV